MKSEAGMSKNSKNLLFSPVPEGNIKRQQVRTVFVRDGLVVEELFERVFFDDELQEYSDSRSTIPLA